MKYRFIEFFVFDSLPIYFQSKVTFPSVVLDRFSNFLYRYCNLKLQHVVDRYRLMPLLLN